MPLAVARESSVRLIDEAVASGQTIAVFAQREAGEDEPAQKDLHPIGTASQIHKMFKLPDGSLRIIVQGLARVRLDDVTAVRPYLRGRVTETPEVLLDADRLEIDALQRNIKTNFQQIVSLSPLIGHPGARRQHDRNRPARRLHRLEPDAVDGTAGSAADAGSERGPIVEPPVDQGAEVPELDRRSSRRCSPSRQEPARHFLREQLKAIQKELGEGDDQTREIDD